MSDAPEPYRLDEVIEFAVVYYSATLPKFYQRIGQHIDYECLSNGPGGFEGKGEPREAMKAVHEAARRNGGKGPTHVRIVTQVLRDAREDGRMTVDHSIRTCGWLLDGPPEVASLDDLPPVDEVANAMIPILKRRLQDVAVEQHFETYQHRGDHREIVKLLNKADTIGQDDGREEGSLDDDDAALSAIQQLNTVSRLKTPIIELNDLLGGGLPRGQYGLVAAESGVGKSTYLTSQLCVGLRQGLNCALVTNELGIAIQYARIYSNLCGAPFGDVLNGDLTLVKLRMPILRETTSLGELRMVYMGEGHTVEDVAEWLDDKEQELGAAFDVVCVDYPDRMGVRSAKRDGEYHAQKVITGGFRDMAEMRKYWLWGATQVQERDEVKIIKGRHLADSMWKKRLIHVGISLNERDDGHAIAYHVFKNTTGRSDVTTSPIPHDKHLARIAPVAGDPWAVGLTTNLV